MAMDNGWRAALETGTTVPLTLTLDSEVQEALRLALRERRRLVNDQGNVDGDTQLLAAALLESAGRQVLRAACRAAQLTYPELHDC